MLYYFHVIIVIRLLSFQKRAVYEEKLNSTQIFYDTAFKLNYTKAKQVNKF